MHLQAERLFRAYPSVDTLVDGKGRKAFTFRDCDEDDGFVFGSKEGEYCLLRIRIENTPEAPSALIDSIVDVQMVYQGGTTVNPKMAEKQTARPHLKEVVVLLEPETLKQRVTSGSSSDMAKAVNRDARFQLHVQVSLAESGKHADIAKIVCWRTVTGKASSLWQRAFTAGQRTMKRLSSVQCLAPRSADSPHPVQNGFKAHRKHQRGGARSELSWRTCFDTAAENNSQYLVHSG